MLRLNQSTRRGYALISPPLIYSLVMLAAPLALVVLLSLWSQNYLELDRTFRLDNYIEATTRASLSIVTHPITHNFRHCNNLHSILAYPIAYYVAMFGGKAKSLLLLLITIPFWTSILFEFFYGKLS